MSAHNCAGQLTKVLLYEELAVPTEARKIYVNVYHVYITK